jgi:F420-dependent oxidoreductase-like protein
MDIRIFTEPQQGATYDELLAVAQATERAGLDGFFRSDHYLAIGAPAGSRHAIGSTDAWATLAGIARETSRIRLGTLLSAATFRLPGPLAITVATVDAMSGGRIELGLGAGWYEAEHRVYGIPFGDSVGERLDRLEEQLRIIEGLWDAPSDAPFSFAGRHFTVEESPGLPKPVQRPRPPIIVGGHGLRRTPAIAALHADELNVAFQSVEQTRIIFAALDRACANVGRAPTSLRRSIALTTVCGSTAAECERRAAAIGRDLNTLRTNGLAGTPDEIAERLRDFSVLGASRVYLQILDLDDLDHVALIGAELAPRLALI